MQIYLVAPPSQAAAAAEHRTAIAHAAYRIGESSTLLRQNLLLGSRGGLLCLGDRDAPAVDRPDALCEALLRECQRWSYQGAVLDFEAPQRQDLMDLAARLSPALTAARRTLYVPERYAAAPGATVLISTALSGGSLAQRMQEASRAYGGRIAMEVERLQMDFTLPAPSGSGEALSEAALQRLMEEQSPAVFFSQDLCARYFTYTKDGALHFVLFDDADTLNRKLRLGRRLGLPAAFLLWPEVASLGSKLRLFDR